MWYTGSTSKGVIKLAEFCTCGSLVIGGHCTNKKCSSSAPVKTATVRAPKKAAVPKTKDAPVKKESNPASARRSSKVISYNLNDLAKQEPTKIETDDTLVDPIEPIDPIDFEGENAE